MPYGREISLNTDKTGYRRQLFGPKTEGAIGSRTEVHKTGLHEFYCSSNTGAARMTESSRMRSAGNLALVGLKVFRWENLKDTGRLENLRTDRIITTKCILKKSY